MSASYNHVTLIGNLTRDPELKFTAKGAAVCNMSLAINEKWKDDSGEQKERVIFVDIDVWNKTAENCAQYLKKGSSAMVVGRLKIDVWDDKQTGQKRTRLGVTAQTVQFLSTPSGERSEPKQDKPSGRSMPAREDSGYQEDDAPPF